MMGIRIYCVTYLNSDGEECCLEVYAYTQTQAEFLAREELPSDYRIISVDRVAVACG